MGSKRERKSSRDPQPASPPALPFCLTVYVYVPVNFIEKLNFFLGKRMSSPTL